MTQYVSYVADEAAMVAMGRALGESCVGGAVVFLLGDLGMGKTTLARGVLQAFGHQGKVKSPTYTLVEPYDTARGSVYHFDLYRLADPEELEYLGIRDYFDADALCLIEWPARGEGVLPQPDLVLEIALQDRGRRLQWQPQTARGERIGKRLVELTERMV
ncbi:tRNA (adenosine(37)-N6)-threonylcarbamoyltransferase complex ATPase subunit type 1 TsaE [Marinobacterium arenosum]|uniref:tRNA (adenosine(37)-N6)-threonylcarbamoyltransferase complex ATPase subunit type 1 TsaE n=1 Tax=Marinobacterium arenosum TaxID=2862496 RepID=UPI001C947E36|nr:tRNA (adenosine(37)-N6)-threonylcarbamoyltransferase complex ATPase subunit type 1 TsaE [Marinobacterium arenosum]MBY4677053.1 tRNA (adenosine(37)-N6)-threonylcarbamoyltransferase complex ATPase subunit type 1 TsaE [Marinobacterium arenosum]